MDNISVQVVHNIGNCTHNIVVNQTFFLLKQSPRGETFHIFLNFFCKDRDTGQRSTVRWPGALVLLLFYDLCDFIMFPFMNH